MADNTVGAALAAANPNTLADVLRKVDLAQVLTPRTVQIVGDGGSEITLDPPALAECSIVATIADGLGDNPGTYIVAPSGSMMAAIDGSKIGLALLLNDGATLQFPGAVNVVTVSYIAAPKASMSAPFAMSAP